jgi:hypothetical protein
MHRFVRIVLLTAILLVPVLPVAASSTSGLDAVSIAAPSASVAQAEPAIEVDLFEEEERSEPTWTFEVLVPATLFLGALTVIVSFFLYFPKVVLRRYRTSE